MFKKVLTQVCRSYGREAGKNASKHFIKARRSGCVAQLKIKGPADTVPFVRWQFLLQIHHPPSLPPLVSSLLTHKRARTLGDTLIDSFSGVLASLSLSPSIYLRLSASLPLSASSYASRYKHISICLSDFLPRNPSPPQGLPSSRGCRAEDRELEVL